MSISQYDAIVNIVINDPTLSVGDVYMANEGAQLYLAIRNSTARLDIEDPSSLINGTNTTWQVKVNDNPPKDLSILFAERDISNDGVVFLAGGSSFTSSTADEKIIVATSTSPLSVITLNTGFGHDALLNSAHVVFDGAQSDYTVSRVGGLLEIKHNNTGDILTSNLNSSESVFEFSGGVILSTEQILQMLVSTTETIYLTPGQTHINTDADINQMFYADQSSSNESIVLSAGGNYNTIRVGQNTTIAHDVLNNGKDTLEMPALTALVTAYENNKSKIKILNVADVNKLSVDIATNGDVTIRYDNSMGNYSEIKGGAGLNTASLIDVEFYSDLGDTLISTFEDTYLGKLANHSEHILAMPEGTSVPPGFTFATATSAGQVIDASLSTFGAFGRFNGVGGSDSYRGGRGNDTFVISSLNSAEQVLIQGVDQNSAATIGYDELDLRAAGINSSVLSTSSRLGNDLVMNVNGGEIRIDDFFIQASYSELKYEGLDAYAMPDYQQHQLLSLFFANFAPRNTPINYTRVIDGIHFANKTMTYAEIAALFPATPAISSVPTEGDDIIYGDQNPADFNDVIDALGGNDIVYGLTQDDTLIGGSGNDQLYGDTGNDILDGGTGIDTLIGGVGDDSYLVDDSADVITESVNEGLDAVTSTVSYVLSANVDHLVLDGTAHINGTGNDLINLIVGNAGNNIIDGGAGGDNLFGGLGNDTYVVDSLLDGVTENANEGTDTVLSSVNYTLGNNLEHLSLQGTDNLTGTGNSLNNAITGNVGNNTLNGGVGNDTLIGGAGNDTYYVNGGDTVTELSSEGTDLVFSTVTYTLGNNVENLTLQGTSNINGTGNALNNVLTGNAGNNVLNGGAGNDSFVGGAGNDTYYVNGGDTVTELGSQGVDTVLSTVTYTLTSNVENLTLQGGAAINGTGNSLANVLTGNTGNNNLSGGSGNDTLTGGAGTDILNGGAGNDTYLFNRGNSLDTVMDTDTTVGNKDTLQLGADVANDQLWFSQAGNNLEIQIIGTNDRMVITNWFGGNANHVEEVKAGDGKTLTDANVQNLVTAMAAMTPPPFGQTTLTTAQHTALDPVITASWS